MADTLAADPDQKTIEINTLGMTSHGVDKLIDPYADAPASPIAAQIQTFLHIG